MKYNLQKKNTSHSPIPTLEDAHAFPNRSPSSATEPNDQILEKIQLWCWLLSEDGMNTLQKVKKMPSSDELKQLTFLREKEGLTPEQAGLITEQTRLQQRAREKFGETGEKMLLTAVGLEQATDSFIAEYKAEKFPRNGAVADICCGIGGDLMALAQNHTAIGVDRDPATAMAANFNAILRQKENSATSSEEENTDWKNEFWKNLSKNSQVFTPNFSKNQNLSYKPEQTTVHSKNAYSSSPSKTALETQKEVPSVLCQDAETFLSTFPTTLFPYLHIDPDRRSEGVRTTQISYFEPSQEMVEKLIEGREIAAVKLAPGTPIPANWTEKAVEFEWIGRNRECRQLVVWFRRDARPNIHKQYRATILEAHASRVITTICGRPNLPVPTADAPGKFLFDPDSTILAAGLEGELAHRFGLKRLGDGTLYLTGDEPIPEEKAFSCFEILKVLPLDKKQIAKEVRERNWGSVEIKKRGNVPEPEVVRKWLVLKKNGVQGTLILSEMTTRTIAILAKKII